MSESLVLSPTPNPTSFRTAEGRLVTPPADWARLPPGDPGLTRRVKAAGAHWVVQEKVGRKLFSRGVWAPTATIERVKAELQVERADPAYARKQAQAANRREEKQTAYVEDFRGAVLAYLRFHPDHATLEKKLADAITAHATPVGSGTVARTERIPIDERAEAATIAWMRHQTTAYDQMTIPRIKGKRREVRRLLAQRSKELLDRYRRGNEPERAEMSCPLAKVFRRAEGQSVTAG